MPTPPPRPNWAHPAWRMLALTFLVLLVGAGTRATPGVLIVPLEQDFGWSHATISAAIAINILLYGMMGPFAVAVMERFGLRRTVCTTLLVMALGVALTTLMHQPWHLMLLWGLVVGSGSGMVSMVLGATVANRWFQHNRGLVLGLLTASSATGQLIFLPVLASLATHAGWRWVALTVALAAALLAVPVALWLRDRPVDLGVPPYGADTVEEHHPSAINPAVRALRALRTGVRSRDFWLLAGSFFICGASTNGLVGTHLIPACIDHGIPEVRAAGLLALMGIFDLLGTTGSGWLTDRVDSRFLLFWYYGLRGLALIYLPFSLDEVSVYGLPLFALFYGLDWIATVPPTVRLAERAFGRENAALMYGWIAAAHQIGASFAAGLAGYVRTSTGSYTSAFLAAGGLCLAASLLVLLIGVRPPRYPEPALSPQ